jgi:putative intracellular protease/amidase
MYVVAANSFALAYSLPGGSLMRKTIKVLIAICLLWTVAVAQEQTTPAPRPISPLAGDWEGTLDAGQKKMLVLLHVKTASDGSLTGVADSVTEDEFGIPITTISSRGAAVHFEALDGAYDGTLSGDQITGAWKQGGGQSLALVLKRTTPERVAQIMAAVPKKMNVAFVISDDFNLIDFAGPWEVFADVMSHDNGKMKHYLHTYTVSADRKPVNSRGTVVVPQYTFADAPKPDLIVIPAQNGSPALLEWLRKQNEAKTTIMSVCTGASILAKSGLIDGHSATSHHDALEYFSKQYPKVKWLSGERYVRSTDNIYTAGGLTSGIDLALHVVELKFGRDMAQNTADYLEYTGQGWKNPNAANSTAQIKREGANDVTVASSKVTTTANHLPAASAPTSDLNPSTKVKLTNDKD